ncbi:Fe(3+)-hydroxamate ABC transporter substrate-binding protein FhuD [Erwinia sp. SLM-02]|uniref:Fe(3+)-hydroxamate ABC transporter substrate-binding protein FhuD n=1 Tax=Erwinia sp. SLM-02 TaxID=3020057 RepID=UPI00308045A4
MPSDVHPSRLFAGKTSSGVDFPRRRLLTALALLPLFPLASVSAAVPQRIIALEWLPLEMLFALGVTPLGAADTHDYSVWVAEPVIPPTVLDIGRRSEPNLEYIAELRPDLLLFSEGYGPRSSQLNTIAPSMEFSFTSEQGEPLRTVSDGLLKLADRLGKTQAGQDHLAWFDRQLEEARGQLAGFRRLPLLVFTLVDDRHVMILGKKSLFGNVMTRLGIENAWQGDDNGWGTAMVGLERLAPLPPLRAICLDHRDEQARARVAATPLWQAIPFVRDNMLRTVPALWIFGATLSALRFCRMLQQQEKQW